MIDLLTRTGVETLGLAFRPALAERLVAHWLADLRHGRLTVEFPSGTTRTFGRSDPALQATIRIQDPRLALRVLKSGDLGLVESYIDGGWDTPDLPALLRLGLHNAETLWQTMEGSWASRLFSRLRHARRANTRAGSRRNIAAHYDLGNAFYGHWLDETMSYSSGLFEAADESVPDAQRRKYLRLARALDIRPGDRILEIGCGWGGFAEIAAAELDCTVVGLTLSREQADYARTRMARAGLSERVEIRLQDYRDVEGQFDKIVSIEMFEAVGRENWATYFATLDRCLKPGGRAGLQIITIDDTRFEAYCRTPDFIQRYIFPGGFLPGPAVFAAAAADSGLEIADAFYFGRSYAETLRRWNRAFVEAWPQIATLGFDERFRRLWHYYLCYCEVGFDIGHIDVGQFVLQRR